MASQSFLVYVVSNFVHKSNGSSIRHAVINLSAAKLTGGRSSNPTLIKIQVVPQIRQRISQTIKGRIKYRSLVTSHLSFVICHYHRTSRKYKKLRTND